MHELRYKEQVPSFVLLMTWPEVRLKPIGGTMVSRRYIQSLSQSRGHDQVRGQNRGANHSEVGSAIRIALIEPLRQSEWASCRTIMPNLVKAYRGLHGEAIQIFHYGRGQSSAATMASAQALVKFQPTHVIFIDHERHPHDFLVALDIACRKAATWAEADFIFHLFGDFTIYTPDWLKSEPYLLRRGVRFVCASARQKDFVQPFFKSAQHFTSYCPFPVDRDEFRFHEGLRARVRQQWAFGDDEFVLLYTGRLSAQKNILTLVRSTVFGLSQKQRKFRLVLAGEFDDLGSPFFGLNQKKNEYFNGFSRLLDSLPLELREKVTTTGQLDKQKLLSLYHASDLFVSLSTHHDEDYGMSPIEALCSGLPAVMSDWGGFASFSIDRDSVELVPVQLTNIGPTLDIPTYQKQLKKAYDHWCSSQRDSETCEMERRTRSEIYLNSFGVEAAQLQISAFFSARATQFLGFGPALKRHAKLAHALSQKKPMFKVGNKLDPNYEYFYRRYCSPVSSVERESRESIK